MRRMLQLPAHGIQVVVPKVLAKVIRLLVAKVMERMEKAKVAEAMEVGCQDWQSSLRLMKQAIGPGVKTSSRSSRSTAKL